MIRAVNSICQWTNFQRKYFLPEIVESNHCSHEDLKPFFSVFFNERPFVLKAGAKIKPFLISARKKIKFFSCSFSLPFVLKADANLQPFSQPKQRNYKNIFRELFRFQASPLLGSQLQAYLPFVAPESGCKYTPVFQLCNIPQGKFPLFLIRLPPSSCQPPEPRQFELKILTLAAVK